MAGSVFKHKGFTREADGYRNAKGEWRPLHPAAFAPLFEGPIRPLKMLGWLLSFPGFLWPWNTIYLGITLATWFYLQPSLATCKTFAWDWVAIMFVRNLALLWMISHGWHLLLYTFKLQGRQKKYDPRWAGKNEKVFLFNNQLYDNIFWSCVSGCTIWTAYEVLFMWCAANGYLWFEFLTFEEHPVLFALWLCAIPFWREFHFYWVHRLIHWKPLYKHVHYLHHKNVNPGPWSGMAMHPVEHLIYFSVVLIHFVVPSHPIHFLFNSQHTALTPAGGHHGFEGPVFRDRVPTGSYFHYLHHRYFNCNFGESTLPLDKWFGSYDDGVPETDDPSQAEALPDSGAEPPKESPQP